MRQAYIRWQTGIIDDTAWRAAYTHHRTTLIDLQQPVPDDILPPPAYTPAPDWTPGEPD